MTINIDKLLQTPLEEIEIGDKSNTSIDLIMRGVLVRYHSNEKKKLEILAPDGSIADTITDESRIDTFQNIKNAVVARDRNY